METTIPGRPAWAAGDLNKFLNDIFPTYRTKLGVLDVHALKVPLSKSHERIYQMLRKGSMTVENAKDLLRVATTEENLAALTAAGRRPPVMEDFYPFIGLA